MLVGYARTSTVDQEAGLEAQIEELNSAGCRKIFSEQVSSVKSRPKLEQALDFVREEDTLIVTKLDRLARSVRHLGEIVEKLKDKGVSLRVISLGLDTATPTGQLILNLMGAIAEFERDIMLERQRAGIAKAKAAGKFKGRKPTARAKAPEILALADEGVRPNAIAARLGIHRASVYRVLAAREPASPPETA